MSGLTDQSGPDLHHPKDSRERTRQGWEASMQRQLDGLRGEIRETPPKAIAYRCGGTLTGDSIHLTYWGETVAIRLPEVEAQILSSGEPCSIFDTAMLVYYLKIADGTPRAGRWIGFRELPNGAFYHQAFQGYSGARMAAAFGTDPASFHAAAQPLGGERLPGLGENAFAFQPLPRLHLAAVLWPGDEDFPAQASVLFDAASDHFMNTDGLALLGSGLTGRLLRNKPKA